MKLALAGVALAAGLAASSAANAASYFLQSFNMDATNFAHIYSTTYDNYYFAAPFQFVANLGSTESNDTFDMVAWCVDIFHGLDMGTEDLVYNDDTELTHDSDFENAFGPTLLGNDQLERISRLITFGSSLFYSSDPDKVDKMAAVQAAIWAAGNPGFTVEMYNNPNASAYLATYTSPTFLADRYVRPIRFLTETGAYGTSGARQALAVTIDVPEPGVWVMMIGGFGFAGAMLRRRRSLAQAA